MDKNNRRLLLLKLVSKEYEDALYFSEEILENANSLEKDVSMAKQAKQLLMDKGITLKAPSQNLLHRIATQQYKSQHEESARQLYNKLELRPKQKKEFEKRFLITWKKKDDETPELQDAARRIAQPQESDLISLEIDLGESDEPWKLVSLSQELYTSLLNFFDGSIGRFVRWFWRSDLTWWWLALWFLRLLLFPLCAMLKTGVTKGVLSKGLGTMFFTFTDSIGYIGLIQTGMAVVFKEVAQSNVIQKLFLRSFAIGLSSLMLLRSFRFFLSKVAVVHELLNLVEVIRKGTAICNEPFASTWFQEGAIFLYNNIIAGICRQMTLPESLCLRMSYGSSSPYQMLFPGEESGPRGLPSS